MKWLTIAGPFGMLAGSALLVGLWLGDGGETYAVSTQPREDQITIFAQGGAGFSCCLGYDPDWRFPYKPALLLDPADYPSGTTFRLEIDFSPTNSVCARLAEVTDVSPPDQPTGTEVSGSQLCGSATSTVNRQRSGPITLAAGARQYMIQVQFGPEASIEAARIVAEWSESTVMGPGPFPVGGYVRLIGPGNTDGESVAGTTAISLLAAGAGSLYLSRTRRRQR